MGINVNNYKILNGVAVLPKVYINIRDINCNKLPLGTYNEGSYRISFRCTSQVDGTIVDTFDIHKEYLAPFTEDIWSEAYKLLKDKIICDGLKYTDVK